MRELGSYAGDSPDSPPFKVQYGADVGGRGRTAVGTLESDAIKDMYVTVPERTRAKKQNCSSS